jgi:adenosylcobinamide kinase/adenosylcobinamide-phosphate guanylyltransferase
MKKITLILGGIRSGKSHFAEQKAEFYSENPVYIATGIPFDREMENRIKRHQKRRGNKYKLIEEPYDLTKILSNLFNESVLVDCLTLNLSNRLLSKSKEENLNLEELIETGETYLKEINEIIAENDLNIIFVSNEVGFSPIESNNIGRYFQDLQGRWNRIMAGYADEVYTVQAGIPTLLKKEKKFPFRIGAPSYIMPGGYIENVTYLMDKVDDIQLLVYDFLPDDPLFKEETQMTLSYLAKETDLTYSIHMPVKPKLFDDLKKQLDITCYIIERLNRLKISSYTFHYDLTEGVKWENLKQDEVHKINSLYIRFFDAVKKKFPGIDIALENMETPLSALDKVVSQCGISYCIDIGHLLENQMDLSEIGPRLSKASVIHLHGCEKVEGKYCNHRLISYHREIFKLLESFRGILTIENYHMVLFNRSMKILEDYF